MNCVYKPCPTALYSAVQSNCSILSHDAFHHYLSSNSSLEYGERELGHLFHYCSGCKITLSKSGYVIQLIAFWWDTASICSSPDPSLSCGSGSGLLHYSFQQLKSINSHFRTATALGFCWPALSSSISTGSYFPHHRCPYSFVNVVATNNTL